jgi:hypothetical protein
MSRVVLQERDRIPSAKIIVIGVSSIVIFAVGVWIAAWMLSARTQKFLPHGPGPLPPLAGQPEIGIVDQPLFETPSDFMDRLRGRLSSYGWVDRAQGRVHIPIERAMKMVVEETHK